jgi:hypothetical protein
VDALIGFAERAEADLDNLDHLEGDAALFLARLPADQTESADLRHHLVEAGDRFGFGRVAHGFVVARILERSRAAVEKNQTIVDAATPPFGNLRKRAKRGMSM